MAWPDFRQEEWGIPVSWITWREKLKRLTSPVKVMGFIVFVDGVDGNCGDVDV